VPELSTQPGTAPSRREIVPGARLTGKVERHEPFGVFVFLAPGRTGLIPTSETGVAKDSDVARAFPIGADVEVVVIEVDPSARRIRLSAKAILEAQEADEVREYAERADNSPPDGFGSLADKLRGAFERRPK
jgi:small subunit ribosomal protein S1